MSLAAIRSSSITANGEDPAKLGEGRMCAELLYERLPVVDAVSVTALAIHVDRVSAVIA
jgi:hypothetical protein